MNISLKSIPHHQQTYETVGNYEWGKECDERGVDQDILKVTVSDMGNEDYHFLVAIHELIEGHLTRKRGIQEKDIAAFDIAFESKRVEGNTDEPGDDPGAPYKNEHRFAENIERMVAHELGVDWGKYSEAVFEL
jgi:hypothetical protein